jgi:hypothetical protein
LNSRRRSAGEGTAPGRGEFVAGALQVMDDWSRDQLNTRRSAGEGTGRSGDAFVGGECKLWTTGPGTS